MPTFESIQHAMGTNGPLTLWLIFFVIAGLLAAFGRSYLKARKIQPNGFKWRMFRREMFWAVINVSISALILGTGTRMLQESGFIAFNSEPASWWVMLLEFALYFFAFDTYFYWLHRAMHVEPVYTWVHKIHHGSVATNPLTTLSVSPLESVVNGGFVPLFTAAFTVHESTMALIAPVNIIMGLYVHSGYEFMPRWWNKSWATRWFITATFHDQHHRFFKGNYGGYTTIWDFICGTVRSHYISDFEKITNRARQARADAAALEMASPDA